MRKFRVILVVVAVVAAGAGLYTFRSGGDQDPGTAVKNFEFGAAPDFNIETVGGESISLEQYRGQVLLINFWATWCAPCREEMPMLIELQDNLREDGFRIVGVSVDEDGLESVKPFVEDYSFNYPIAIDDGEMSFEYSAQYAVPTSVLVDRQGKIRHRIVGLIEKDVLLPIIEDLLSESA